MRSGLFTSALVAALVFSCAAQTPMTDTATDSTRLRITHGPVVENVTETGAIIAWSTNMNAGTVLHYGLDPDRLDQTAGMPWGGFTHRVELSGLRSKTTYFFRAESPHAQGTGENAAGPVLSFATK